jgi:hypothetical protein
MATRRSLADFRNPPLLDGASFAGDIDGLVVQGQ